MNPRQGRSGIFLAVLLTGGLPATTAETASASTSTNAKVGFDSCSVVTQSEASAALGTTVTSGVLGHATVEGGLSCVFYGPSALQPRDSNVAQPDTVRVAVAKGPDALKWYKNYQSRVAARPVSGYGDQAYYDGYASLSVLKGDYYLLVAVSPAHALPSLKDEEQLAKAILPKL